MAGTEVNEWDMHNVEDYYCLFMPYAFFYYCAYVAAVFLLPKHYIVYTSKSQMGCVG